jgi:diguanylate cyclase (GGDEF)-like protein
MSPEDSLGFFERIRASIARLEFCFQGETLHMTTSIGVCTKVHDSLSHMLNAADTLLYKAKSAGRDQVASDLEDTVQSQL